MASHEDAAEVQSASNHKNVQFDISICIVNWNSVDSLHRCLRSILVTDKVLSIEIIVVDNGSVDGSADSVARMFPGVRLIRNTVNRGFAAATNQALTLIEAPYALLLNPDITVHEGAIGELYTFMGRVPDCGAASGILLSPDGSIQKHYYRRDLALWEWTLEMANGLTWNVAAKAWGIRRNSKIDPLTVSTVGLLPGGCMMVRSSVLTQVGMLDEAFFVWYEDVDWSRRIRQAGWNLCVCPTARFSHIGGESFQQWSSANTGQQILSSFLIFLDKHYAPPVKLMVRAVLAVNLVHHLIISIVARLFGSARRPGGISVRDRIRWILLVILPRHVPRA